VIRGAKDALLIAIHVGETEVAAKRLARAFVLATGLAALGALPAPAQAASADPATIGVSFVLDQLVHLVCSPGPRTVPSDLADGRLAVGVVSAIARDFATTRTGRLQSVRRRRAAISRARRLPSRPSRFAKSRGILRTTCSREKASRAPRLVAP